METTYIANITEIKTILNGDDALLPSKFTLIKFDDYLVSIGILPTQKLKDEEKDELVIKFIESIKKRNETTKDTIVPVFDELTDVENQFTLEYSLSEFDKNMIYIKDKMPVTLKKIIDNYCEKVLLSSVPTFTATSYDFEVLFR